MSVQHEDFFAALAAPFEPHEVKVRAQAGRQLHYITARTAQNRLDEVCGPAGWWDHYIPGENSVICQLTLRLPDGSTITKEDAGGYAGMADSGDDNKSGFSDAFKRAASKWLVGRYLYLDGVPSYAREGHGEVHDATAHRPPPSDVNGSGDERRQEWNTAFKGDSRSHGQKAPSEPRTGRALFAWTKEQEQRHEVGLLKYLNSWAKLQDFPGRMVDWDAEQVAHAYSEATRKLQSIAQGAAHEEAMAN